MIKKKLKNRVYLPAFHLCFNNASVLTKYKFEMRINYNFFLNDNLFSRNIYTSQILYRPKYNINWFSTQFQIMVSTIDKIVKSVTLK